MAQGMNLLELRELYHMRQKDLMINLKYEKLLCIKWYDVLSSTLNKFINKDLELKNIYRMLRQYIIYDDDDDKVNDVLKIIRNNLTLIKSSMKYHEEFKELLDI